MPTRMIWIFIFSFAFGVFAASFFFPVYSWAVFCVFLGSVFLTLFYFLKHGGRPAFYAAIFFIAFGAGIFWYGFTDNQSVADSLEKQVGLKTVFTGIVVDEPDERENYTRLVVFDEVSKNKILIYTWRYPSFRYGDEVEISGALKKPENFNSVVGGIIPSSSGINWSAYLAKDDIYFEMFYPEIKLLSSGKGSKIKQNLFALKDGLVNSASKIIPEPHSALLSGIVLGAKRSMPAELLEDFRKTGIIHVVVLSGYNVTIVADAIMRVLKFLPQSLGIGFGVLGITLFALMTGASATVVRAAIMAVLVLLARATGRIYQITIALFAAGFLMVFQNPKILRFDVSFQLSFLATLALIYLAPIIEPKLKVFPKKWKIREFAGATISTQIFVLPLLLYNTGIFSLVGLPVNILILPFIPATMFFGFMAAGLGFASTLLGTSASTALGAGVFGVLAAPFGWTDYILLGYQLKVVEFFSSLPFSSFSFSRFPFWLTLFFYAGYAILIYKYKNGKNKK